MSKRSFLPRENVRNIIKKIVAFNLILYICIAILIPTKIYAVQSKYPYSQGCLGSYPGYDALIQGLQARHPNWNFTILNTGLDWNDVIKNETVASHGRNLIYYTYSGSWVCSTCGNKSYDSGRWKCASETAVAYYMDPRNWLNDNNIFQFENLAYNGDIQNIDGVNKILSSVPWANGSQIYYTRTDGSTGVIYKSYAQVIMEAARDAGISPYHLAARIKQEQGTGSSPSATANGTYGGHVGYYNFLNIKATGGDIIGNALNHARNQGWDDPEKAIRGGATFIASGYISRGQSTLYLQKFDVDNSDGSLYYHQYMQNVSAALTEGNTVRSSYESMGLLDSSINFVIPVYNNMPAAGSYVGENGTTVTQNVKITGNDVIIRNGRSRSSGEITRLNSGDVLLRIEVGGTQIDGYYWDKVVLSDGTKGYVARDYITRIDDVTNANTPAVANVNVNLRNGPGTVNTTVIRTLTSGQAVTVIESGKYNGLDGYNWSRVKLNSGDQGYLVSDYVTESAQANYQMGYVDCNPDGKVYVRSGVGTGNAIVTALGKDTKVTILQKSAGDANGYTWDKIVTLDGLEGYMANVYLRYEESSNTSANQIYSDGFKLDGENLIIGPDTTVEQLKQQYPSININNVATGIVVNINGKNIIIVKLGDVNGDGHVKATDYMKIKNYIMGTSILDEASKKAADVNKDGQIKATDYMKIKNYIMGTSKIEI